MGNSMYDKNEIEDSLEFCRQIKEYEDISATDKGTANESQDKSLSVMAEEMETQSHSWDHILQEQDPVSVDFDAVKPFIAPPESETSAKAMGGLLEKEEEAKRIQEKQREQARQKALARAEAAKKANEEAVRLKAEQERKAAEEAARLKAEQERKAAKEAALEQHRHELELQNKLQQQRAETEALARKQQQLEEAEAQRIAQAQREAVARTRAKLQQQRQQELAKQQETLRQQELAKQESIRRQELAKQESIRRQELERQREVQARQEAMRLREQEKQARQLAAKQEQLQREEEARAHAAAMEQARQQMEVQSRKQADQAEQLRLRIEAQKQQTEQEQLRIEQEQQQRIQKQREAESAARETFIQSNSSLAAERQRAAMEAEAEARILQERAEELKRQAEVAALEARIHQLEQESARARGEYAASYGTQSATQQPVYTDPLAQNRTQQPVYIDPHTQNRTQQPVYTDPRTQNTAQQMYTGTSASGYPGQTQTAAGSVSKQKLSEKQINEIFAQGLEKERKESRAKRNALIQRQADKENARIRQERAENGVKPPVERVLDMVKVGKDKAVDILSDVFHTVKEKSEDPELQEQKTKASRLFGNLLFIAICVFIAYCVASVVTSFVVNPTKVEGESMESTLTNGDTVLIQKMSYYFGDPKRYDVVVFPVPYYNSDTKYIKRVIGLPGETVQIIEGKVYINGKELKDDTYGKDKVIDDPGDAVEPITLADDEYFVLGDNRNMSTDSRSSYVGLIRRKSIIGKACARIFPLSKMGGIAG